MTTAADPEISSQMLQISFADSAAPIEAISFRSGAKGRYKLIAGNAARKDR